MSGYLIKLIKQNEDLKESIRNVQNGLNLTKMDKRMMFERDSSLNTICQEYFEYSFNLDSSHIRVPYGTNRENYDLKGPIRKALNSNNQKTGKMPNRVMFKEDSILDVLI